MLLLQQQLLLLLLLVTIKRKLFSKPQQTHGSLHAQELQATKDIMSLQQQQLLTMQKKKKKKKIKTKAKKWKNATPPSKTSRIKKLKKAPKNKSKHCNIERTGSS
jgi:hypothetical protein